MASTTITGPQPSPGSSTGGDGHVPGGLRLPLLLLQPSREDADAGNVGRCPCWMHCSNSPSPLCRGSSWGWRLPSLPCQGCIVPFPGNSAP